MKEQKSGCLPFYYFYFFPHQKWKVNAANNNNNDNNINFVCWSVIIVDGKQAQNWIDSGMLDDAWCIITYTGLHEHTVSRFSPIQLDKLVTVLHVSYANIKMYMDRCNHPPTCFSPIYK
jgi:hypothetical protein